MSRIMIGAFRRCAALCVVAAVVLTGHQAAMARAAAPAVGEAVICIGQTVERIKIGADGQPVRAVHLCPDAALSLIVALEACGATAFDAPRFAIGWERLEASGASGGQVLAAARGPPRVF